MDSNIFRICLHFIYSSKSRKRIRNIFHSIIFVLTSQSKPIYRIVVDAQIFYDNRICSINFNWIYYGFGSHKKYLQIFMLSKGWSGNVWNSFKISLIFVWVFYTGKNIKHMYIPLNESLSWKSVNHFLWNEILLRI